MKLTLQELCIPQKIEYELPEDNELFGPFELICYEAPTNGASGLEVTAHLDHPTLIPAHKPYLPIVVRKTTGLTISIETIDATAGQHMTYANYERTPDGKMRLMSIHQPDGTVTIPLSDTESYEIGYHTIPVFMCEE